MKKLMSLLSRRELLRSIIQRYRAASRKDKQRILDEFVEATGCHRKYAAEVNAPRIREGNRLLLGYSIAAKRKRAPTPNGAGGFLPDAGTITNRKELSMKRAKTIWACLGVATVLTLTISVGLAMTQGAKEVKVKAAQLPAAVAAAIKDNCPNCVIDKATREVENGVTVYDIEFKAGQGEMDVAADGSVIDREIVAQTTEIPKAALEAIRKGAAGGAIKQVAKDEIRAELKEGKIIKLDTPRYIYEADLVKGGKVAEIQVSPEGRVIEAPKWKAKGAKEN